MWILEDSSPLPTDSWQSNEINCILQDQKPCTDIWKTTGSLNYITAGCSEPPPAARSQQQDLPWLTGSISSSWIVTAGSASSSWVSRAERSDSLGTWPQSLQRDTPKYVSVWGIHIKRLDHYSRIYLEQLEIAWWGRPALPVCKHFLSLAAKWPSATSDTKTNKETPDRLTNLLNGATTASYHCTLTAAEDGAGG